MSDTGEENPVGGNLDVRAVEEVKERWAPFQATACTPLICRTKCRHCLLPKLVDCGVLQATDIVLLFPVMIETSV